MLSYQFLVSSLLFQVWNILFSQTSYYCFSSIHLLFLSVQDLGFKYVIPFIHTFFFFYNFIHLAFILGVLLKFILFKRFSVYLLILFQKLHISFFYALSYLNQFLFNTFFYHIQFKKYIFFKMSCFLKSAWEGGWWGGNKDFSLSHHILFFFSWTVEIYG